MEDPRWLRLVTVGLVLAALAVGYFLLTGRLASNSATRGGTQISRESPAPTQSPSVLGQSSQPAPTSLPATAVTPTPTPMSAYNRIVNRTQVNTQSLPRTGFPVGPAVIFSLSALITGWGLRRFPK